MRKGLREIAGEAFGARIVFLAQQADVVAQADETAKQPLGVVIAVLQHIDVDQPEAAGEERALARRQRIVDLLGAVAHNEAVAHEVPFDRRDGIGDAPVG